MVQVLKVHTVYSIALLGLFCSKTFLGKLMDGYKLNKVPK
jgi:hypothetical protein